jgi:hypothetical protein
VLELEQEQCGSMVRRAESDERGVYRLVELPPGRYSLSIAAPGFAARTVEALDLEVGQSEVLDLRLDVEGVAETVEAVAAFELATESSTVDGIQSGLAVAPLEGLLGTFHEIVPVQPGIQLTLPSIQDGTSFRVPRATDLDRIQIP